MITSVLGIRGIDYDPEAVRLAKQQGVAIDLGDAHNLPYKDGEFESVFMGDTLEHLEFPQKAISEARRVLTKYLYITVSIVEKPFRITQNEFKELVESQGFVLEGEIWAEDQEFWGKFKKIDSSLEKNTISKIIDGLRLKGQPAEIPNCSRDDLPQFFVDMGFKVGAEIGVYKAEYTVKLCRVGLKMYAVDPWQAYEEYNYPKRDFQKRQDFLFGHAQRVLAPYPDVVFVRKFSMDAVKDFADGSLDFVYIDANHSFKHVTEDICEWSKKVRKGGVISGHDFRDDDSHDVRYVLEGYTKAAKIPQWFVLGKENEIDRDRSWLWIKS